MTEEQPPDSPDPISRFEMPRTERNALILEQTVERKTCRACGSSITPSFSLGPMFVNDFPEKLEDRGPQIPLTLAVCDNTECEMVQLTHTVPRDALYRTHYWYRSGVNETMRKELAEIVEWGKGFLEKIEPGVVAMDIGANDGTLLKYCAFNLPQPYLVAFEPASNMRARLEQTMLTADQFRFQHIEDYFPNTMGLIFPKPRLIFSIAMFYDVEDPQEFMNGISEVLAPDGVWVVQLQDLWSMLRTGGVDCMCHEHLAYYSLKPLERMAREAGLVIVGAVRSQSNGGSLRLAFAHRGFGLTSVLNGNRLRPTRVEYSERALENVGSLVALEWFSKRAMIVRTALRSMISRKYQEEVELELLGASTKGNTLLQWLNLGPEVAHYAIERAPEKIGRMTITGIPIRGEGHPSNPGTCRIVLPWHFKESLINRERDWLKAGGTLLFPLPTPKEIGWAGAGTDVIAGRIVDVPAPEPLQGSFDGLW